MTKRPELELPEATPELVTITEKEYEELRRNSDRLAALDDAGVDNWAGYDEALKDYYTAHE